MDAAVASIIGAAIGATAVGGAGTLAWRAALGQARIQSQAQLDVVRIQVSAQRNDAMWTRRRDGYAAFVQQIEAIDSVIRKAGAEFERTTPPTSAAATTLSTEISQCWHLESVVRLDGPEAILAPARDASTAAQEATRVLLAWAQARGVSAANETQLYDELLGSLTHLHDASSAFVRQGSQLLGMDSGPAT